MIILVGPPMELGAGWMDKPRPSRLQLCLENTKKKPGNLLSTTMDASAILTTQCSQTLNRGSRGEATALWAFKLFWGHCPISKWSHGPHNAAGLNQKESAAGWSLPIIILSKTCSFGMVYLTWHIEVENDCLRNDFPSDFRGSLSLSLAIFSK